MREKYESLALLQLKELAKVRGIKGASTMKKAELVEAMLAEDEKDKQETPATESQDTAKAENREKTARTQEVYDENQYPKELDSGVEASGILEVMPDGYGFIRCENYLPGENDVYVAPSQIRRFGLKTGDILRGNKRVKTQQEKFSALLFIRSINGYTVEEASKRKAFEDMTPIFPDERIKMETPGCSVAMRVMDLVSPVGKFYLEKTSRTIYIDIAIVREWIHPWIYDNIDIPQLNT